MTGEVLKLNAAYMPLGIINWQTAVRDWMNGEVEVLDSYEDRILYTGYRANEPVIAKKDENFVKTIYNDKLDNWTTAMQMPAVIRVASFTVPKGKDVRFYQAFTRKNIYERDHGVCQYCGKPVSFKAFTFDHVIPKSRGGLTTWNNIVCSCLTCNAHKANKTPKEANMKLRQKPFAPLLADNFQDGILNRMRSVSRIINNKKWRDWIYWNVELDEEKGS